MCIEDSDIFKLQKGICNALREEMKKQKVTKVELAKQLQTSRSSLENILDPKINTKILSFLRIAKVLGMRIEISLMQ